MNDLPLQNILILLLFLALGLADFIFSRIRRRLARRTPTPRPAPPAPPEPAPMRRPSAAVTVATSAPKLPRVLPVSNQARLGQRTIGSLRTRSELQRAIMAMTILGPCRAEEYQNEVRAASAMVPRRVSTSAAS